MKASHPNKRGFTLVELLVVMAIIAIITAVSVPSIYSLTNSNKMNQATSELQGLLEQARQYAVAQNTYVWVAFSSATTSNNLDTLTVAVIASNDGSDPGVYGTVPSTNFSLISSIRTFPQLVLQNAGQYSGNITMPTSLPTVTPPTGSANALSTSVTFNIQLPAASTSTAFNQCLEFTPSGEARNSTSPINIVEFLIEPTKVHGVPNTNNVAVLRVNGLTGQTIVYRK